MLPLIAQGTRNPAHPPKKANAENPHWPCYDAVRYRAPRRVEVVQPLAAISGNILHLILADGFDQKAIL